MVNEYVQNEMIRESYAYNSIRSKESKQNSPHSHSLWENVCQMSPNVAGIYIPLKNFCYNDGENATYVNVKLELIIPFTDQLALQAWRLYPNRILGEIEEEINTSLNGLVWCQLQPQIVGEMKKKLNTFNYGELNAPTLPLSNCFNQIGSSGNVVYKISYAKMFLQDNSIYQCTSSRYTNEALLSTPLVLQLFVRENKLILKPGSQPLITLGRTNLMGFGVKPDVVEGLLQSLHEPIIIPSQELTRYIFEQNISDRGINVRRFVPLRNATNITMMFPRYTNECTVFQNINHLRAQLRIDKRNYPHLEFENTWDARFVQYQLMANELDGNEAPPEFLESISKPTQYKSPLDSEIYRLKTFSYDNTNFGINFQLERGNSGYVFDGLDTNTRDVEIQFIADSNSINPLTNSYYYPDVNNQDIHPPSPEMWICSDTYWTWSVDNGVQYHKEGVPINYE